MDKDAVNQIIEEMRLAKTGKRARIKMAEIAILHCRGLTMDGLQAWQDYLAEQSA